MKKLAVLLAVLMTLAVFPSSVFALAAESGYETLFDRSSPIEIDIRMDDETWDNMIATAEDEEYSSGTVVINGVTYENVGIRPKGNSSMSSVTRKDSERYSWRIKFDKYDKEQTCDGLDILILNNGFNDPGSIREAISYDMYAFLDADASLFNYAIVYHNGEYFGVYLALEGVDESFVKTRYDEKGELYKPELAGMGAKRDDIDFTAMRGRASGEASGEAADGAEAEEAVEVEAAADAAEPVEAEGPAEAAEPAEDGGEAEAEEKGASRENRGASRENRGASREGGFGASNSSLALALNYVGDDLEDYQGIWDSAKFKSDEEDYARVVEALKHVCQGDDIESYLFVDNVLKYFAIQSFIYNRDGLTGNVSHNYYLYEQDGKLNLIPWDLNESFTVSGDGSAFVNFPIDTPFTVSDLSQRSFFMALLEDEDCLAQYHEYLRQLSEEYVQGGRLASLLESIFSQVGEYYQTDPTSFADSDTIQAKAEGLQTVIELRAEGVLGQLNGDIPSTRDGQEAEPEKLLDTSDADLSGLTGGSSREMRR